MANIKSAEKRNRTATQRRLRNRAARSAVGTMLNRLLETVASGDRAQAGKVYREFCSVLDKAAKAGRMSANTVARRKSRGMRLLAGMAA